MRADIERALEAAPHDDLRAALRDLVDNEARASVRRLTSAGRKPLVREVARLRGVLRVVQDSLRRAQVGAPVFAHAEAFLLMRYAKEGSAEGTEQPLLLVWNSRDGATAEAINLPDGRYVLVPALTTGPHYERPASATHSWVTRSDGEVLLAWGSTLDRAVALDKMSREKADAVRGDLAAAESWGYRLGLRETATGRFTYQDWD